MVFTSLEFISLFLPITLAAYFFCEKLFGLKVGNVILLIFSLLFMLAGSGKDILILFAIVIICYITGLLLDLKEEEGQAPDRFKKKVLTISIICTISILLYYKYSLFFAENVVSIINMAGFDVAVPKLFKKILLPLGISFYTFQALSYVFDRYLGKVKTTYSLLDFMLYVAFFPQIIAGPVVRYIDIYEQIQYREVNLEHFYLGCIRFISGAIKKSLTANFVAQAADNIFSLPASELHMGLVWAGIITYTLQIFLDFSAYSDMAIGLAKMFGFDLLENFNYPYTARSIQDFWRRWHISLSTWFRDYVYIPLGGNRVSRIRTYVNLVIVFLVCGFWHGADWVFIIWGLWHGCFLALERTRFGVFIKKLPSFVQRTYAMLVVMIGWVFFRSPSMDYAISFIRMMFIPSEFNGIIKRDIFEYLQNDVLIAMFFGILVSAGLFRWLYKVSFKNKVLQPIYSVSVLMLFLLVMASLYSGTYNPFIYFRF